MILEAREAISSQRSALSPRQMQGLEEGHNTARKGDSRFPFRRLVIPALFVAALFAVTVFRDWPETERVDAVWTFSGPTMGTTYNVKVVVPELDDATKLSIHKFIRGGRRWRRSGDVDLQARV